MLLLFEALPFSDMPPQPASDPVETTLIESVRAWRALVESADSFRGAALRRLGFEESGGAARLTAHVELPGSRAEVLELRFDDVTAFDYVAARGAGGAKAGPAGFAFRFLSVEVHAASCQVTRVRS